MNERHEQNRRALGRGNLFHDYPKAFTDHWEGCAHLHCLAQCSPEPRHCERLRIAFADWTEAHKQSQKETAS